MALEPNPALRALRVHTYMSREAAVAGGSAVGGGCGCYLACAAHFGTSQGYFYRVASGGGWPPGRNH